DDTLVLFGELFANGSGSDRAGDVVDRMGEIHARFNIAQEDYLYTLVSIIDEPERSAEIIGYTSTIWAEHEAWFRFWRRVGERMGIEDLPATYRESRELAHRLERE